MSYTDDTVYNLRHITSSYSDVAMMVRNLKEDNERIVNILAKLQAQKEGCVSNSLYDFIAPSVMNPAAVNDYEDDITILCRQTEREYKSMCVSASHQQMLHKSLQKQLSDASIHYPDDLEKLIDPEELKYLLS